MSTTIAGASPTRTRPVLTLIAVCVACGLLPISLTGASVALPGIGTDLHAGLVPLQWIVNGYDLVFASFMLAAGSMADRIGRRRVFTSGVVLFCLASLASGLLSNIYAVDAARALAGLGAAAVMTSGAAMLAQTFQGPALARAFGILGTSFGIGLAFGPFLAGLMVSLGGWRWVFLLHAIVAALVVVATRWIAESRSASGAKPDWWGTVTFTSSLFLFVLAVVEGPQIGWLHPLNIAAYIGCVALMTGFVMVERRQAHPMFDLSLFSQPKYVAVCVVPVALAFGFVALLVYLPSYFMSIDGNSAQGAGLILMLLTAPTLVLPAITGIALRWLSARSLLVITLLLVAAGTAWLTVIHPGASVALLAGPFLTIGIGFGISLGVLDATAVSSVEPERAGMAAGMFNTTRLAGEVVAIAGMGSLLVGFTQSHLATGAAFTGKGAIADAHTVANQIASGNLSAAGAAVPAGVRQAFVDFAASAYTDALHTALWILVAICAVGAPLIGWLLRDRKTTATTTEVAPLDASVPVGAES
ncbi:MAG TPA: MFS transporter [Pseudonocardiaceae bacterium]|nr:MFS transporter [Pseudonocardiaceae bacterium]